MTAHSKIENLNRTACNKISRLYDILIFWQISVDCVVYYNVNNTLLVGTDPEFPILGCSLHESVQTVESAKASAPGQVRGLALQVAQ